MTEQQIQAYVMGELPPEEAALVAEALAQDPSLAALEEEYRTIKEGFRRQRVKALQQATLDYDKTLPPPPTPPTSGGWVRGIRFGLIALITAIVLSAGLAIQKKRYYADEAVAQRYFQDPPDTRVAGANGDIDSIGQLLFDNAIEQYFSGDYPAAHANFEQLADVEGFVASAKLYLPHASFKLEDYTTAALEFEAGLQDPNLAPPSLRLLRWNNIVNDLALGKDIVPRLEDEKWPQSFKAEVLREELDSFWR